MTGVLIDSNVILDILNEDAEWYAWSAAQIERLADECMLVVNPIIYSEVSIGFDRIEDLDRALPEEFFRREPLPWEAGFLAGKCFVKYRRSGGARHAPLPDFYIGAHAAISGYALLTRDARRYKTYFPTLELIAP
ncbi:MAG: type II toxin-antitoxin system VapC family toxin [Gammaproteobacteria bacterium]|nr:type II toxin-antitoxin system VapC family toxin [Gammaproteobacteria bacterium]